MLAAEELSVHYGRIAALVDVTLSVLAGEVVGVVGPNGAGKSTLLKTIAGLHRPTRGEIRFEGVSLVREPPERIVRRGIALVPEGRRILTTLTVEENLFLGAAARTDRSDVKRDIEAMTERFPVLRTYLSSPSGRLSGGEQQQLAIARALMSRPRLLLIDEPSLGLAPRTVDVVFEVLDDLRKDGVTVVLVEQNALRTVEFADRTYVLASGQIQAEGNASELRRRLDLKEAYLGSSA